MTAHDKALEAATARLFNLTGHPSARMWTEEAITAYHAALEGRGESEIAEIRKWHEQFERDFAGTEKALVRTQAHEYCATLLSRLAELERERDGLKAEVARLETALAAPIDMVLFCPICGAQHIDAPDERTPDWKNPPHKSHLCHDCGCIWRQADRSTNGVTWISTHGSADTFTIASVPREPLRAKAAEAERLRAVLARAKQFVSSMFEAEDVDGNTVWPDELVQHIDRALEQSNG